MSPMPATTGDLRLSDWTASVVEAVERSVILMVDDEEPNLDLLEAFLQPDGYENLVRTSDAREVCALLETDPPDLVLLDLHMPHRSGFELLEEIRARTKPDDYLPVLVLTADITAESRARALSSGARDFLTKPLDALEVRLRVRNLLEARALHRAQRAAREAAESLGRRSALLAEASVVLASAGDANTTLERFAQLVVPGFAELCIVCAGDAPGDGPVAVADAVTARAAAIRQRLFVGAGSAGRGMAVVNCGEPVSGVNGDGPATGAEGGPPGTAVDSREPAAGVDAGEPATGVDAGEPATGANAGTAELPAWWQGLGSVVHCFDAGSMFHAPLSAGRRRLGEICFARRWGSTPFDGRDLSLAGELAHRAALALENAQLVADAQQATRTRDQVLSFVAHDLRNPLASIAANAEMVRNLLPPRAPSRQRDALNRIEETARRSHALVEDLLEVSRLERGTFAVRPEPIPPVPLFAEALEMLRPLARARAIELVFDGADEVPAVAADGGRVLQLLSNLVGNALKFTPEGGQVRVGWQSAERELTVYVEDEGTGIPIDRLPHLFGSSWRAGTVERRRLGLGLVIARAIVDAHGGRIWVESVEGAGARFCFTLPFAACTSDREAIVDGDAGT